MYEYAAIADNSPVGKYNSSRVVNAHYGILFMTCIQIIRLRPNALRKQQ